MPTDQTSSPLTRRNPLRSIFFARPTAGVLGLTAQQTAEWNLTIARRDVPLLEQRYAVYCAALGSTNMLRGPMRRHWQAKALQQINRARAQLCAARRDLVTAEAAMLQFALPRAA